MKINKKQQKVKENINLLNEGITDIINEICKEADYKITYAEINTALSDVISNNLKHELRKLYK